MVVCGFVPMRYLGEGQSKLLEYRAQVLFKPLESAHEIGMFQAIEGVSLGYSVMADYLLVGPALGPVSNRLVGDYLQKISQRQETRIRHIVRSFPN